jgi:hypothetical protein
MDQGLAVCSVTKREAKVADLKSLPISAFTYSSPSHLYNKKKKYGEHTRGSILTPSAALPITREAKPARRLGVKPGSEEGCQSPPLGRKRNAINRSSARQKEAACSLAHAAESRGKPLSPRDLVSRQWVTLRDFESSGIKPKPDRG